MKNADFVNDTKKRIKHVKKFIRAIEDLLEGKITQDVQSYSIEGRSLTRLSLTELLNARQQYLNEYRQLKRLLAVETGLTNLNKIVIRF